MFSFRNRFSPTTSTMLKLNRSPCTITIHQWRAPPTASAARIAQHALDQHAALARDDAAAWQRDAAAVRLTITLLENAIGRLAQGNGLGDVREAQMQPSSHRRLPTPAGVDNPIAPVPASSGTPASGASLLFGIASAVIAASVLAPKRAVEKRLASHAGSPSRLAAEMSRH